MVTEIAIYTAIPDNEEALGQRIIQGLEFLRQHPECISTNVTRCVERPERYMLSVVWISVKAYRHFCSGPLFPKWRDNLKDLLEGPPEVFFYQPF